MRPSFLGGLVIDLHAKSNQPRSNQALLGAEVKSAAANSTQLNTRYQLYGGHSVFIEVCVDRLLMPNLIACQGEDSGFLSQRLLRNATTA